MKVDSLKRWIVVEAEAGRSWARICIDEDCHLPGRRVPSTERIPRGYEVHTGKLWKFQIKCNFSNSPQLQQIYHIPIENFNLIILNIM